MSTSGWFILVAGLAGQLLLPLRTRAQYDETTADVRCVLVGLRASALQQSSGSLEVMYYLGRLDGREPKLDLEALMTQETPRMTQAEYASEAVRCGKPLTLRGQQLVQIGKNMAKRGL